MVGEKKSPHTLRLYYYKCCYKYCKWRPRAYRMIYHLNENPNKIIHFFPSTMLDSDGVLGGGLLLVVVFVFFVFFGGCCCCFAVSKRRLVGVL